MVAPRPLDPAPPGGSPATTTKAVSRSRATRVRRIPTSRESGGAPSSTTSPNAPLRSSTSALQAPRSGFRGRITHNRPFVAMGAQSRGASVRVASM